MASLFIKVMLLFVSTSKILPLCKIMPSIPGKGGHRSCASGAPPVSVQVFSHLFQVSRSLADLVRSAQQDVAGSIIGDSFMQSMLLCLSISKILLRAR